MVIKWRDVATSNGPGYQLLIFASINKFSNKTGVAPLPLNPSWYQDHKPTNASILNSSYFILYTDIFIPTSDFQYNRNPRTSVFLKLNCLFFFFLTNIHFRSCVWFGKYVYRRFCLLQRHCLTNTGFISVYIFL